MTAQEWLDELERLRKAATPGPWEAWSWSSHIYTINKRPVDPDDERTGIAESLRKNDAAYIVAACNAVPRLVKMVQAMSSVMAGIPDVELTPDEILWDFFEDTEPKE
jgi:hypothetical protein